MPILSRFDTNLRKGSVAGKMLLNSMAGRGEMFHEKNNSNWVCNTVILHEIVILQ